MTLSAFGGHESNFKKVYNALFESHAEKNKTLKDCSTKKISDARRGKWKMENVESFSRLAVSYSQAANRRSRNVFLYSCIPSFYFKEHRKRQSTDLLSNSKFGNISAVGKFAALCRPLRGLAKGHV